MSVDGSWRCHSAVAFNDWRDKTLLEFNREDVTRIVFKYPADSSFVLEFRDSSGLPVTTSCRFIDRVELYQFVK
jgi:hypothetical protein